MFIPNKPERDANDKTQENIKSFSPLSAKYLQVFNLRSSSRVLRLCFRTRQIWHCKFPSQSKTQWIRSCPLSTLDICFPHRIDAESWSKISRFIFCYSFTRKNSVSGAAILLLNIKQVSNHKMYMYTTYCEMVPVLYMLYAVCCMCIAHTA